MMNKFKNYSSLYVFMMLLVPHLSVWCNSDSENMSAPMEKKELDVLYSAIQGFVGKWWNGSDLYPDPCGWTPIQGVSCDLFDGFWYVTGLNIGPIHDNSLSCAPNVEFSPNLFQLKHLQSLSFFNCFLSPRDHPVSIPTDQSWESLASSLQSLEFRSNPGLVGQIPTTFGSLRKLQSLVLVENGLSGALPTNLGNLVNLKRLVLAGNKFTGKIPDSFGGYSQLLIYDLSRNSLSGVLPSTLGGLVSVLKLDLSNNLLEGKIPEEVGKLKNLTLLDLSNNNFSSGLTKSLQEMTSLEELVMSNNPTSDQELKTIEWHKLIRLTVLDLSNMSLIGGIPESIAELKKLRFLGLNDNKLSGEISSNLETLPNVSAIYLNGNNLTGELQFSEWFYGKMGRRFGAWDNPNICYPFGLMSTSYVPFGVKQCQQQEIINLDTKSKLGNEKKKMKIQKSHEMVVSLGLSSYWNVAIWRIFVVELFMVVLVNM